MHLRCPHPASHFNPFPKTPSYGPLSLSNLASSASLHLTIPFFCHYNRSPGLGLHCQLHPNLSPCWSPIFYSDFCIHGHPSVLPKTCILSFTSENPTEVFRSFHLYEYLFSVKFVERKCKQTCCFFEQKALLAPDNLLPDVWKTWCGIQSAFRSCHNQHFLLHSPTVSFSLIPCHHLQHTAALHYSVSCHRLRLYVSGFLFT